MVSRPLSEMLNAMRYHQCQYIYPSGWCVLPSSCMSLHCDVSLDLWRCLCMSNFSSLHLFVSCDCITNVTLSNCLRRRLSVHLYVWSTMYDCLWVCMADSLPCLLNLSVCTDVKECTRKDIGLIHTSIYTWASTPCKPMMHIAYYYPPYLIFS